MHDNKTAYSITFRATQNDSRNKNNCPQMLTIYQDQNLLVSTYKNGWKSVKIWQMTIGARQIKCRQVSEQKRSEKQLVLT